LPGGDGMSKYGSGRWHCEDCKAKFNDRWELILHEEQVHRPKDTFKWKLGQYEDIDVKESFDKLREERK
jgi:hypothetical protein